MKAIQRDWTRWATDKHQLWMAPKITLRQHKLSAGTCLPASQLVPQQTSWPPGHQPLHHSALHLHSLGTRMSWYLSQKTADHCQEHNEDLRADFIQQMGQYSTEEIGFLDEFSKDERTIQRHRGWTKRGKRACMGGVFVCGRRVSGEGLLTLDGIVASTVVEGSMTWEKFLHFLEHSIVSASNIWFQADDGFTLLDAFDFTIPRKAQCPCHGQCTNTPWRRDIGASW